MPISASGGGAPTDERNARSVQTPWRRAHFPPRPRACPARSSSSCAAPGSTPTRTLDSAALRRVHTPPLAFGRVHPQAARLAVLSRMKYVLVTGACAAGRADDACCPAASTPRAAPPLPALAGHPARTHERCVLPWVCAGGVVSGLGKGVTASSIGVLLKACGHRVTSIKIGGRAGGARDLIACRRSRARGAPMCPGKH